MSRNTCQFNVALRLDTDRSFHSLVREQAKYNTCSENVCYGAVDEEFGVSVDDCVQTGVPQHLIVESINVGFGRPLHERNASLR